METENKIYLTSDELVCEDPTYRYKADRPMVEDCNMKGTDITIIKNIDKLAKQLILPEELIITYLAIQLSCSQGITKGEHELYLRGKYSKQVITGHICSLIREYVLCDNCDKPEILYKGRTYGVKCKCKACGEIYKKRITSHKLLNLFNKYYSSSE